MDAVVAKLQSARASYALAKQEAAKLFHALEEVELEVINTLKANGRLKYDVPGVAMIRLGYKDQFTTPKTNEQKRLLFKYIQDKYGVEVCTSMLSVNSQTLNAWANKEIEAEPTVQIPGLDKPSTVETLYFTVAK